MLTLMLALSCSSGDEATPAEPPVPMDPPAETEGAAQISDTERIKEVVQERSGQLKSCYEDQLAVDPTLEGRVELKWRIAGGAIHDVVASRDTTGSQALVDCLVREVSRWTFPEGIEGEISWPFLFEPAADVPPEEPPTAPGTPGPG